MGHGEWLGEGEWLWRVGIAEYTMDEQSGRCRENDDGGMVRGENGLTELCVGKEKINEAVIPISNFG